MYETASDLQRERQVTMFLMGRWGVAVHKLPVQYRMDYFAAQPRSTFLEIKCRTCNALDYPFYILSAAKLMTAVQLCTVFKAHAAFVFAFADGEVRIIDHRKIGRELCIHGRKDRGDKQDMEPCVKIDPEQMTIIRESGSWE